MIFLVFGFVSIGQENHQYERIQIEQLLNEAKHFTDLAFYAEASQFYQEALDIADSLGDEELELTIEVGYIELLRKSYQNDLAYDRANGLKNIKNYPTLYAKLLNCKTGIFPNLTHRYPIEFINDSISFLIKEAIQIAEKNKLKSVEAGLKNQLGFQVSREKSREEGNKILQEASQIFQYEGDTQNFIVVNIHILENAIVMGNYEEAKPMIDRLLMLTQGHNWWTIEIDLYNQIADYYKALKDDYHTIYWEHEAAKSFVKYNNAINNSKMAAFKAMYENQKFKELADRQKAALEDQQKRNFLLFLEILGLVLFMLVLVILWIRETRLRATLRQSHDELEAANARYQMLLVESNHRIKNNLQMVVSMLNFSRRDSDEKESDAIKRVTKSVYTIASLHKHLYPDIQSESVSLRTYFDEIFSIYDEITLQDITLVKELDDIRIKSDKIVYFGLVLSELISNTLEHCSKKGQEISISISVKPDGDYYCFYYSDGSAWAETDESGTGMTLIELMVKTLGGQRFTIDKQQGSYRFLFAI